MENSFTENRVLVEKQFTSVSLRGGDILTEFLNTKRVAKVTKALLLRGSDSQK